MTAPVGETLGVEEEFHLVAPDTLELCDRSELLMGIEDSHPRLRAEMLGTQLESTTDVCMTLAQLRDALTRSRQEAADVAAAHGAALLGISTHPLATLDGLEVLARPRYARLHERFGRIVHELNLVGCHVHVGVPDLDTAVAVMTHARPYLPLLGALTCSSPFHEERDTGWHSYRLALLAVWPHGGPPPALSSSAEYVHLVDALRRSELIDDASTLLWQLRPSAHYPTLEFRIADMCPSADDAVLYAALARSLVRTLGTRVQDGVAPPEVPDALLRAAGWRAARYGMSDALWSPTRHELVPAWDAVDDLHAELQTDLDDHGEADEVQRLLAALRGRGTSADQQRATYASTQSLYEVTRAAVDLTAGRRG